ncbi:hypothetical protein LCGC14_1644590 [marine sediment metagenome]|uniref:Uncharacterized protein n=1 Tax=marine sediment metagenome TaxID=412755 RepID=A0A0F9IL83_9ZZZZ
MKKWICSWLTMKRTQCLFIDIVEGKEVFEYIDCYGQKWMANYMRWGFRVKII